MRDVLFAAGGIVLSAAQLWAQAPNLEWSYNFGGSGIEVSNSVQATSDGGYIVAGNSFSQDGDLTLNQGGRDVWLIKLRSNGTLEWQRSYGGSGMEGTLCIAREMNNGGYVVVSLTTSDDGDVACTETLPPRAWVVRTDESGNMLWQRCLGGSSLDNPLAVTASGNGCIIAGFTNSSDGDSVGNHGQSDMWVVKLDETGEVVWSKCFGGSYIDTGRSIAATPDGGCIVGGDTRSNDGDVAGSNPYYTPPASVHTGWVVKLDAEGNLEWQACHGGPGTENIYAVALAPDGSYVMVGRTTSSSGDVSGHHGATDGWIFRLSAEGEFLGQRCLGGSGTDQVSGLHVLPNGNILVAGYTNSTDGDVLGPHLGSQDSWVLLLDPDLEIIWERSMGGSDMDNGWAISAANDGGAVVSGYSRSLDGDLPGNNGEADVWVVKLAPWDDTHVSAIDGRSLLQVYPNPANDLLTLRVDELIGTDWELTIKDATGRSVYVGPWTTQRVQTFSVLQWEAGLYSVLLRRGEVLHTRRFVIAR